MVPDWVGVLLFAFGVATGLAGAAALRRRGWAAAGTRRLVHAAVCGGVAASPWLFSGPMPMIGLAAAFVVGNGLGRRRGWWPAIHAARPDSWGTVTVPLAVLPAAGATWGVGEGRLFVFPVAFCVLGVADPLAAWVGERWGRGRIVGTATLAGTATVAGTATLLVGGGLWGVGVPVWEAGPVAVIIGVVAAAVEAVSERGWDNLFVVLAVIAVLVPWVEGTVSLLALAGGLGAGVVVAVGAGAVDALTRRGAVGGGLFAMSLVALGGAVWAVPGFAFFTLSSALSVLPGGDGGGAETEDAGRHGPRRTLRQVMANGSVAWGLLVGGVLLPPAAGAWAVVGLVGGLGALAAAAADTWATELGTRFAGRPWSLRTGTRVAAGASGAVSIAGTVGAMLGAGSVVGAGWVAGAAADVGMRGLLCSGGAGVLGMVVDSLLGATVQARYRDPGAGRLVEAPIGTGGTPERGWAWMDNDTVNLVGTTVGAVGAMLAFL